MTRPAKAADARTVIVPILSSAAWFPSSKSPRAIPLAQRPAPGLSTRARLLMPALRIAKTGAPGADVPPLSQPLPVFYNRGKTMTDPLPFTRENVLEKLAEIGLGATLGFVLCGLAYAIVEVVA